MAIRTINQLHTFCSDCDELFDILSKFTLCKDTDMIINDLKCNDTLWAMADENNMTESSLEEWINDHWESSVQCRVFQEHGPAGGWPVVEIQCLDRAFYIDWVLE